MNNLEEYIVFEAGSEHTASEVIGTIVPANSNISLASGTITQSFELEGHIAGEKKITIPLLGEIKLAGGLQIKYQYKREENV